MTLKHLDNAHYVLTRAQALALVGSLPAPGRELFVEPHRLADVILMHREPHEFAEWRRSPARPTAARSAWVQEIRCSYFDGAPVPSGSLLTLRIHW